MHEIMKGLEKDHQNLAQVLKIMELQLDRIAEGDDTALALMLDASHYIQSYPDIIHHPKENKIFEVFKNRSNEAADTLDTLFEQHETLPAKTIKFQLMLDQAINGLGVINRDELIKQIKDFIEHEWEHINLEEDIMFPFIVNTLEKEDWILLEELIEADSDPIFSDMVEETFENLYQSIKAQVV